MNRIPAVVSTDDCRCSRCFTRTSRGPRTRLEPASCGRCPLKLRAGRARSSHHHHPPYRPQPSPPPPPPAPRPPPRHVGPAFSTRYWLTSGGFRLCCEVTDSLCCVAVDCSAAVDSLCCAAVDSLCCAAVESLCCAATDSPCCAAIDSIVWQQTVCVVR